MTDRTLFTILEENAARYPSAGALYQPTGIKPGGQYRKYTWTEYRDSVRDIACGLRVLGVAKGDIVALHAETRAEFYITDLGIMSNGAIAAALYTSLPLADHLETLARLAPKALVVENAETMDALRKEGLPAGKFAWILLTGEAEGALSLEDVRKLGREALASDAEFFERIKSEVKPEDHAVLYMTSGATGQPKMGLVTHHALISNIDMGPAVLPLGPEDSTLAFLPSAHIAQRVVLELMPIRFAMPVYFSEGLAKMPNELRELRPTFLLAPPRVWERVYSSICTEIKKRPAVARKMFYGALGLGLKASRLRNERKPIPAWMQRGLKIADRIVFQKIRARLGGRLRVAASGAAPLSGDLAQFFEAIGLPLIEGYGLTEGGVASLNPIDDPKPGSIGKPLPGVEMRVGTDGELLIRSPCLFSGYYQDPEATAAVLRDGWLHTGDIAEIDKEGSVYITGRKKELIVSSNGKKIYPARIEGLFKVEPLVNQVLLIGDRQPYVTALITINTANAETLKGMEEHRGKEMAQMVSATPVVAEVGKLVKRVNQQLAPFEQIKRFRILERDFSIERGELTPTMKVRRTQVIENFRQAVNELYLGKEEMV